jgi:hypothetical protein
MAVATAAIFGEDNLRQKEFAAGFISMIEAQGLLRGLPFNNWSDLPLIRGMQPGANVEIRVRGNSPAWTSVDEGDDAPDAIGGPDVTRVSVSVADSMVVDGLTDELRRRDDTGMFNIPAIVEWLADGYDRRVFAPKILALAEGFDETVGDDGDPLTWATVRQGLNKATNAAGVSEIGGQFCILSPQQWDSVRADIEASNGQIQMRRIYDSVQAQIQGSYVGTYDNVDFFKFAGLPEGTEGHVGFTSFYGNIWFAECMQAPATDSIHRILDLGVIAFDEESNRATRETTVYGYATLGAGIVFPAVGCQILGKGEA